MERKAVAALEVKAADLGVVTARFATLGVKDADGDVIEPGAIGRQRVKVSAYGHQSWQGALPVGKGHTFERRDEAIADLRFFMDTAHGRDHFTTLKELGDLAEWSFGFDVEDEGRPTEDQRAAGVKRILRRLRVHEVSPVLRGAGVGTRTLALKCSGCGADVAADELMERGRRVMQKARSTLLRVDEALRGPETLNPDAEARTLARFANYCGRLLVGGPIEPQEPRVKFFLRNLAPGGGRPDGFVRKGEGVVWAAVDLKGEALVETVLHECAHLAQRDLHAAGSEEAAETFARRWTKAVAAAFRYADGATWRVRAREGWPPFGKHRHGDVVLAKGRAYFYNRRAAGPSWQRIGT